MVNGRPRWREREPSKRFGEHLLQVILGGDADGDVRIEVLARCFRNERRDIVDGRLVDVGSLGVVTKAAAVPVFTVKGATALINFC